jgi:apolipoprotein D and lipocalin family protein
VALGVARVIDDSRGARLKVNFTGIAFLRWLGIGDGDYWILGLGPINEEGLYSWALVGSPKLDYGWVLARRPSISEVEFDEILRLGEHQGYKRGQFKQ